MHWLLTPGEQETVRTQVEALVRELSTVTGNPQDDQIFPYVGRKDRRKAKVAAELLVPDGGIAVDPFAGSGVVVYGMAEAGVQFRANEWEPYANRMANAPWRLPDPAERDDAIEELLARITPPLTHLYRTRCTCGADHVLDSLFFDRDPLEYRGVTNHERLGPGGGERYVPGAVQVPQLPGNSEAFRCFRPRCSR